MPLHKNRFPKLYFWTLGLLIKKASLLFGLISKSAFQNKLHLTREHGVYSIRSSPEQHKGLMEFISRFAGKRLFKIGRAHV